MKELVLLYGGCIFLMYLSQVYYPAEYQMNQRSGRSFLSWRSDLFMVIVIAWMSFFSCLRTNYNDTTTYIATFYQVDPLKDILSSMEWGDITGNPLSIVYRSLMHELTDNYHIYFFFPAFFSCLSVVKLFKHYSLNPAFSLLIFLSIGTYVMYIAALKQCLAMFFLLWALPYALDKKYFKFYLLVFVAVLFHTHAFMFAIVPLLTGRPWRKATWIAVAGMLLLMITYDTTMRVFMEIAQSMGAMVAEREVFDGHQINVLRVMVYWVPALLALFFQNRLFNDSSKAENLFVNMSIVAAIILSIGLVEGANLYARMAAYFEIAIAVSLPWMIQKLFTRQSTQYVTIIAAVLYFGYFLYEFGVSKNFDVAYASISLWDFIKELFR